MWYVNFKLKVGYNQGFERGGTHWVHQNPTCIFIKASTDRIVLHNKPAPFPLIFNLWSKLISKISTINFWISSAILGEQATNKTWQNSNTYYLWSDNVTVQCFPEKCKTVMVSGVEYTGKYELSQDFLPNAVQGWFYVLQH